MYLKKRIKYSGPSCTSASADEKNCVLLKKDDSDSDPSKLQILIYVAEADNRKEREG